MTSREGLEALRRASRQAELRMRLGRALWALPTAATLALGVVALTLVLSKVLPQWVSPSWAWSAYLGAALSVVLTVAWAALIRLPPRAGALALDDHYRLHGRVTNALEFAELAGERRTAMMELAIDDACRGSKDLSPSEAVRIRFPMELLVSAAVALAVFGLSLLEVVTGPSNETKVEVAKVAALQMSPDDLELFKDALDALEHDAQNSEVQAAIERFNQLIEDIESRRLNRTEAFRRMQEIENDLLKGAEADKKALEEALKDTAKELDKSELTKPLADALKKNDLGKAEQEMRALAERMKDKKNKPSKAELERLKQALDRAAKNKDKALEQLQEQRAELQKQLLEKKKQDKPQTDKEKEEEKSLLKKKKRELERLTREIEKKQRAKRRLSKLDRDLAKAAADLMRDLGMSAEDMEQAAEDLNRMQQEQMTDTEKEELRRRLQEMRELIRQQGQGGQKMRQRLQRFMRRARGMRPGEGQQGQGQQGQGKDGQGKDGQGKDGQGMGQGKQPGGMGLGPGGEIPMEMPGAGAGQGDGQQPGDGAGQGGKEFGKGAGGDPKGDATNLKADTHDVRAEGLDTGQGPSNAEVILSAAKRGFTGKPYKNVYKQYKTVAEDQIETEKIPDGMRFYVRRYFQLIRPRE